MTNALQEHPVTVVRRSNDAPTSERIVAPGNRWRTADAVLAVGILTVVVISGNLNRMPRGLNEFMALRLSVKNGLLLGAFSMIWPLILSLCGLYAPARLRRGQGEWPRLLLAAAVGGAVAMVFPLTSRSGAVRPEHVLLFALLIAPAAAGLRAAVRLVRRATRTNQRRQVVIVGSGPLAQRLYSNLQSDPLRANEVIGFVDSEPHGTSYAWCGSGETPNHEQCGSTRAAMTHLGGVGELERILMHRVVDDVIIALPIKSRYDDIQQTILACERVGVPAKYPADLFGATPGAPIQDGRIVAPTLSVLTPPNDPRLVIKRAFDLSGAAMLLVLLSPLLLTIAVLMKITAPGPLLFSQERYGFRKRRFKMLKFRTMVTNAESLQAELESQNEAAGPIFKIRDDPRVTRIGRILRRSSLDELPQLWNVLIGEMSLVGPRPMSLRDVGLFTEPWLMRRFSVVPGLTGLWQVSGRSDLAFDKWVALDLEYIQHWSLRLDAIVLLRTIPAVLKARGAA